MSDHAAHDAAQNSAARARSRFPLATVLVTLSAHAGLAVLCGVAWFAGWWPVSVVCWGALVWMNHAALTHMHEAAHGTLSGSRIVNESLGVLIGTAAFIPLGVYRYVHARHHAHLGGPLDPEFWPYNLPGSPRALRIAYAWLELLFGWIFTPMLYSVRTALSWRRVPARHRPHIVAEWALIVLAWAAAAWVIGRMGWIEGFVVVFLAPAWGAGVFQTLRKFTEHLGMHGSSILSMTRTVAYQRPFGRAASRSQLHVDHHGTHHRHARIPFYELPRVTPGVYAGDDEARLFPSHLAAMRDMAPHLLDPKLGPQWVADR